MLEVLADAVLEVLADAVLADAVLEVLADAILASVAFGGLTSELRNYFDD